MTRHLSRRPDLGLALIVMAGFAFLAWNAGDVSEWSVMTDELQNAKLGVAMAKTLSPVPHMHGEYFGALSILYPLLTAPFYGLLDMPDAFRAVHFLNAALMASAAIPAYLLTRSVVPSRAAAWLVAALTVLVPWAGMTLMLMTESAAYPAFLWALLAFQRATLAPSVKRDAVALVALGVAFFARTQFVVLAAVLPAMVLVHEVGYAVLREAPREAWPALRRALREHALLMIVCGAGALIALVLAVTGSLGSVLGSYEVTTQGGDLLPAGINRSVVAHLDFVIVAIGVIPFVLGGAWILASLVSPLDRQSHAFAVMAIGTVPLLAYEVASFNLRFANGGVQDRYLFYIAPLFFIGMAAWLSDDRRRVAIAVLVTGVVFALVADYATYAANPGPYFSSPSSAFHQVLDGKAQRVGELFAVNDLAPATLISILTVVAAVALAAVARFRLLPGRVLVPLVGLPVLLFGLLETGYVFDKMIHSASGGRVIKGRPLPGRDWIDTSLPSGAAAGLLPPADGTFPVQALWWETELFNKDADRSWSADGGPTYTPFPAGKLTLDLDTGTFRADRPTSEYLVMSQNDRRFELAGAVVGQKRDQGLALLRPARPYRAAWASQDIDGASGSLLSENARVRIYPGGATERADVRLTLLAPDNARRGYELVTAGRTIRGSLPRGQARTVTVTACVPPDRFADVEVRPTGTPAPDATTVAVTQLSVLRRGGACRPA